MNSILTILVFTGLFLIGQDVQAQGRNYNKVRIVENTNGKSSYHWVDGSYSLKIEVQGDIEWTPDERGVKSVSRNGYLEITEKKRGGKYSVVIEESSSGNVDYVYRKNGKKRTFDNEGQEWLADILPQVIRETGIGAESRVERILGESGVDGVFDEIELIKRPGPKSLYMLFLFEQAELTGEETVRAAQVAKEISSPGDKSRFLKITARMFLIHDESKSAYFDAVRSISSPGDKTRTLLHLVDEGLLKDEQSYIIALQVARTISSPGDKSRFLQHAVPVFVPAATDDYFEAVNTISSPGDHARVLTSLLESPDFGLESVVPYLESARRISSPGDKARVLAHAADWLEDNGANERILERYFETVKSISSPGDQSRVMVHIIDAVEMSDASMLLWLDTVKSISSPGDKARVLLRASERVEKSDELVDAYLETAETISSPGERRRVLGALID